MFREEVFSQLEELLNVQIRYWASDFVMHKSNCFHYRYKKGQTGNLESVAIKANTYTFMVFFAISLEKNPLLRLPVGLVIRRSPSKIGPSQTGNHKSKSSECFLECAYIFLSSWLSLKKRHYWQWQNRSPRAPFFVLTNALAVGRFIILGVGAGGARGTKFPAGTWRRDDVDAT